jgi:type II secretory pathway component PulM
VSLAIVHIAVAPALPLHTAGKYVAAAYIVFLALVLVYVAIMATRLARTERDLAELQRDVLERRGEQAAPDAADRSGREREPVA